MEKEDFDEEIGDFMEREKAINLLKKYNKEEFHVRHAFTVEQVMRYFARENLKTRSLQQVAQEIQLNKEQRI